MIQYLHRLKGRKGFTMVELVVVFGIIAILIAVIAVGSLSGSTERGLAATASSETYFSACQLMFTRIQNTEREIVNYDPSDTKFIEFANGVNKINGEYLFIEMKSTEKGSAGLHVSSHLDTLMEMADPADESTMTVLEKYLMDTVSDYIADSYDGYFYAMVDNSFKVLVTHFSELRFPVYTAGEATSDFVDSMMFYDGRVKGSHGTYGSCYERTDFVDDSNTADTWDYEKYAFCLPAPSDSTKIAKYIKNVIVTAP